MNEFVITEAKDWQMLITMGGISWLAFNVILLTLIGVIWKTVPKERDLFQMRQSINLDIKELTKEFEAALEKHLVKNVTQQGKDSDALWKEMHRCQAYHERALRDCQHNRCTGSRMQLEPGE